MTPNEWAEESRKIDYHRSPESQKAIDILESVLAGELAPQEAANMVVGVYPIPRGGTCYGDEVGSFWGALCEAIRIFGGSREQSERLADILITIQSFPDALDHDWRLAHWKNLPGWALTFREYGIDTIEGPDEPPYGVWNWQKEAEPLLGASTFAATLLARAPFPTDTKGWAREAMKCALENSAAVDAPIEDHQWEELYMPSAATWILIAHTQLRQAGDTMLFYQTRPPTSYAQRWNSWKRRFEEVAIDPAFLESNREWAARAASLMEPLPE